MCDGAGKQVFSGPGEKQDMTSSRACRCSRSRAVVRTAPNPVVLRPQPGTLSHAVDRRNQFRRGRRKLGVAVSALLRVASALAAEQAGSRFEPTTTIQPIIEAAVAKDTLVHTDEYGVYARLPAWRYRHKTVCHAQGEYARDEDGDGFCEVHVNTIEGFWSLLRSWLRPHRGLSQDKLPLYLGFFQFVHNARRRGKALLGALVAALVL